ncbi:hypothetical protein NADE_005056 [Nannochloris sp. 'desiccata']|nr:hypothetical protein NADE_005056 [Chlorella desiccata (nom. nud.)]
MAIPSPSLLDWSDLLASSVVTHTPLPITATQGLTSAFIEANVSELRIILAQGSHHELAIYSILSKGAINLEDMDPIGHLPLDKPSLAVHAMKRCATVSHQSPGSPTIRGAAGADDKNERVDWEEMKSLGCDWALAAPMACTSPRCERLLGAVLIAGKSSASSFPGSASGQIGPSINPEWLKEWSCELAQGIAHASVSVMESSLDMLRLLYPPKVVEALVYNAIAPGGHPEEADRLAELLEFAAASLDVHDDAKAAATAAAVAAGAVSASAADFSISAPTMTTGITEQDMSEDATLASTETQESASPRKTTVVRTVNARNLPPLHHNYPTTAVSAAGGQGRRCSPVQHSPFAALSAASPFSPTPPLPPGSASSAGGEGGAPTAATGSTSERTSTDSYEDRGEASGGRPTSRHLSSPSHMAAAVLRQASLQSRQSLMNSTEDLASMSPANSEVEGYEDLLSEDATARAMRRPSYQLDRAHSYESMDSDGDAQIENGSRNNSDDEQQGNQHSRSTAPLSGSPPPSPRAAVVLVHGQEQQEHQLGDSLNLSVNLLGEEAMEDNTSPRVAVIFPAPYATSKFHSNSNQELGAGNSDGGRSVDHYHNGGTATVLHPHRTFHQHQAAYSHNQQNHHQHHHQQQQQHMQHMHSQSLSTISEGGSRSSHPDVTTMTSRSLSSQLNSFPSNPSPLNSLTSTPASSLHWDQEWDLAFADARVEQKFTKHIISQLVAAEAAVGATILVLATTFFAMYPQFSLNQRVSLYSGGLVPLLLLFTLPLFISLGAREAWMQHRLLLLPALRLLAALMSATWLDSLGFAAIQAVPLGVLSLTNPMRLRFHIPLQLLCMWASIQPGIKAFLIGFLVPTAVIYVAEQRLRRNFMLETLAAATAASGGGLGAGAGSPGPVAAAGGGGFGAGAASPGPVAAASGGGPSSS